MPLLTIFDTPKSYPIYTADTIKAWEERWFAKGNSSFGLMEQASLFMANHIEQLITPSIYNKNSKILVCCGVGNNGGDGYLVAKFLASRHYEVAIFAPCEPVSADCQKAKACADELDIPYVSELVDGYDIYVDAFFGAGLNKPLSFNDANLIDSLNYFNGLKIALDVPSGLLPDTGATTEAFRADYTLCVLGLKMGLLTAKGRHYAGKIVLIPLIAEDEEVRPLARIETYPTVYVRPRVAYAHKGNCGHVLIIGGHKNMGGAVIMAGESAMACGAGKVTIMCHKNHHQAILSRSPNIMVKDIEEIFDEGFLGYLEGVDNLAFGMGLGRDAWSERIYLAMMTLLSKKHQLFTLVLDADALYFLAKFPQKLDNLAVKTIATPHSAEAGRLLGVSANEVEQDRVKAIYQLKETYGENWVLKGSGSLILEKDFFMGCYLLSVCPFGNAGMATAGMGDVLSGILAGILNTYLDKIAICVNAHALAGDELAKAGERSVSASDMPRAIRQVLSKY